LVKEVTKQIFTGLDYKNSSHPCYPISLGFSSFKIKVWTTGYDH